MKKIKDLIYDFNDIFVALLIIAAAGAIIFWRVTDIMAYPDYLAGKAQTQTGDVDFTDVDLTPTTIDEFNETPDDISTEVTDPADTPQPDPQGGGETPDAPVDNPEPAVQTPEADAQGNYIVEIPKGSSAAGIAKILKEKGIIDDADAFMQTVEEMDATLKMKYGTYSIPQGSTYREIIEKLM